VSAFRPAARITGPDGRDWEIYAFRFEWPARRRLCKLPSAVLRALRTNVWTIEAVTYDAHHERHRWPPTSEYRGQVLAQVEGSIARGDFPVPRHAAYDNRSARYRRARG
jgi:hypothetical protein